ncbi:hypothetical protein HYH03_007241 [Edaphochlamys debaryana]|uniref:Rieske-like [2Fe-2S] domain-containing protein n=1 Tax=Edaphochlamys debaryana TaxID=47281 RepID=A0A836C095_9CHLO|nr:hypothetical protein HYH03_007241 [Edaphochlamys debaryana]|eukprot:KAG2494727.1 hypothetical protein HYH03_007241 [Edaphochlamys debaryana]
MLGHTLNRAARNAALAGAPCTQPARLVPCRAGGGFGKTSGKAKEKASISDSAAGSYLQPKTRRVDLAREFAVDEPKASDKPKIDLGKGNWFELATTADFAEKPNKLVELKGNKKMYVMHQFEGQIYAMDAYSTAYQYPLLDGKVEKGADGPTIETKLDGTIYDLKTGKVVKWCPSDGSPIRGFLRTLKANVEPVPLAVYPVVVQPDGKVMVRLSL